MCFVLIKIWLKIIIVVLICVVTLNFVVCSVVQVFRCKKHMEIQIALRDKKVSKKEPVWFISVAQNLIYVLSMISVR